MGTIQELARDLDAEVRTLQRAAAIGTLRSRRLGPRRLKLDPGERGYLGIHWELLADLRRALRNERSVRLAVLYGSVARGDDDETSDIDLLVDFADPEPTSALRLVMRLEDRLGRAVDVARFDRVEERTPGLLLSAIDDGRVIVDRDDLWPSLRSRRRAIRARADRADRRDSEAAAVAIGELTAGP